MVGGEQFAGAPESGGDLVEDQQHIVLVADSTQFPEIGGVVETHTSGALDDGFDDDRGQFVAVRDDSGLYGVDVVGIELRGRGGHEHLVGQNPTPHRVHPPLGIADAHRGEGVAVVPTAPGQQARAARLATTAPILQRHLHRDLDRHRTRIAEEHLLQGCWCDVDEQLREPRGGLVGQSAEHHVAHRLQLIARCGVEDRVAITVDGGPPRAHSVDDRTAVGECESHAVGVADDARLRRRRHGAVGMPDVCCVDAADVGCIHVVRPSSPA
ncbi:Uncharacterised protein [Mycobacteroides abscessus subsp. abscessus]|nr:Uncharacterised protein [Mycobacteroides abscessus subsp. abscessus]